MGTLGKVNTAPQRLGRNHGRKPKDAHSDRGVADQTNKYTNNHPIVYSNDSRGELCSLFNHHPRVVESQHFNKEPYQGFSIYTKEIADIKPELYEVLCRQYHDGLVQNNRDLCKGSLIIRSIGELIGSYDIVLVAYQDRLVGAIRLQRQPRMTNDIIFQRGSLYVLPEFRGDLAGVNIRDLLIRTINQRNQEKPIYSVVKTANKPTINSSLQGGFKVLPIKHLRKTDKKIYDELVSARGGEDFRDMDDAESPDDYSVTYDQFAEKLFFPDKNITPRPDAQGLSHESDIPQGDVVLEGSN